MVIHRHSKSVPQGRKGLLKKSIRIDWRKGPGLKPLDFAGFFVGLKPHANPKSKRRDFFNALERPNGNKTLTARVNPCS